MRLLVNGINVRIKVHPVFPASGAGPRGFVLAVEINCEDNKTSAEFCETIVASFRQIFPLISCSKELENGSFKFLVTGCKTELEAVDLMRAASFQVSQQPPSS